MRVDMPAETLNCPGCGAPASTDATACDHCGARLATVACPACFGLVFQGAKFCSHCGAKIEREEVAAAGKQLCPRCNGDMGAVAIGTTRLRECAKCEGLWVETAVLEEIREDREKQTAVLGMGAPLPVGQAGGFEETIRYLPCPQCRQLMNRINFANCSHVIVDVCRQHGTWFDKDELRRIIEFIRGGGMEQARAREISELEAQRNQLRANRTAGTWDPGAVNFGGNEYIWRIGWSVAAAVMKALFR